MLKLIIIVATLIAGYIAYLNFEPHIPARLSFLKLGRAGPSALSATKSSVQAVNSQMREGWAVQEVDGALFFHRQLSGRVVAQVAGKSYDYAPADFYLICETQGTWVGLDASAPLAKVDMQIDASVPRWQRSGSLWVAKDEGALRTIRNGQELGVSVSYADAGRVDLTLPAPEVERLYTLAKQAGCQF
jgi:hypothetical protein